jgi:asparagine synthase (glutamine-hydrolysing)
MSYMDIEIVFSDLGDLASLALPSLTINLRYLSAFIYYNQLQIRETGYSEITEVLAGECVECAQGSTQQFSMWDPRKFVAADSMDDYDAAEAALRRVTQRCINAWAGVSNNVLLSLSGGFDSAVVLGCLARAPVVPKITCFNQCLEGSADDERKYARLAASRANVSLLELPWSDAEIGERVFEIPKAPKPSTGDLEWWLEIELRNDVARRTAADAIWTGQGGDHLFWAPRNHPIAADYVARNGIGFGFPRVVGDAARLFGDSYLSVIRKAIVLGFSKKPWRPEEIRVIECRFVNFEALPDNVDEYIANPWIASGASSNLPKTKQAQILFLADVLNRHRHLPGAEFAYQEHPLLSQPLMELCLQIPTYLLVRGGRRRAMARSAFRDLVPREIVEREDKGDTAERSRALLRQNQAFLRDLLWNGILARSGILQKRAIEDILLHGQSYREEDYWPLRSWVTAEIWAQTVIKGHSTCKNRPLF